ncbi:MAG: hypothetical protein CMQ41_08625 [Gammaproteobacteria bacterium]|nr:hypothetical protein [Gammaproteobacteria bacterium]|tara:strand:+ start:358 stop:1056 length:699 start_codon:yes stop_codon:yes gene_type:complete
MTKNIWAFLFCWCSIAQSADIAVTRKYIESEARSHYDELLSEYGNNKQLPKGFELQALLALSHYPELKSVNIRFLIDDVRIPLSSRPLWTSLFRSAKERTYLVVIDNSLDGPRSVLLLKNQPFNAQVGIIGHELAHTLYYLDRSFLEILTDALCQFSNCRINFERNTDRRLIEQGLGWQRYDHAVFVHEHIGSSDRTETSSNRERRGPYMSPAELLDKIENNEIYKSYSRLQ